jgi:hypothetical protein
VISIFANLMPRVLRFRNYGVYVNDERGTQHHLPHAHIKNRDSRIASLSLFTLTLFDVVEQVPNELLQLIEEHLEALLAEWERLNHE